MPSARIQRLRWHWPRLACVLRYQALGGTKHCCRCHELCQLVIRSSLKTGHTSQHGRWARHLLWRTLECRTLDLLGFDARLRAVLQSVLLLCKG